MIILDKPPYKSVNGMWYTEALFVDRMWNRPQKNWIIKPIFTFFDKKDGYICGQETFIELGDPTGYKWAMTYLGDYNHWLKLMRTPWFPEIVETWREHLATRLRADALEKVRELAASDSSQALAAAKYLAEEGWKPKAAKGRPSKDAINGALKQAVKQAQEHETDAERIGLRIVSG